MKKLLTLLASTTFMITSCGGDKAPTTPPTTPPADGQDPQTPPTDGSQPDDNEIVHTVKGIDNISNMGTNSYTKKDMRLIEALDKSTFSYTSSASLSVGGTTPDSTNCSQATNTDITDSPITQSTLDTATPNTLYSVYAPEKTYKSSGTSFVIDENTTHYFIATNSHVAMNIGFSGGKNIAYVSDCVMFSSNDERNIKFVPDYSFDYANKSLVENNPSDPVEDTISNTIGSIFIGNNIPVSYNGNTKTGAIDMAIFPVKKTDVKDGNGVVTPLTVLDFGTIPANTASSNFYTTGYPSGTKRYNKTTGIEHDTADSDYWNGSQVSFDVGSRKYHNKRIGFKMWMTGGSSGSPVIDDSGKLIGINSFILSVLIDGNVVKMSESIRIEQIKDVYTNYLCPKALAKSLVMNKCSA